MTFSLAFLAGSLELQTNARPMQIALCNTYHFYAFTMFTAYSVYPVSVCTCVCVAKSLPKPYLVYPLHQIGGFSISICVVKSLVCHLELDLVCHLELDLVCHLELDHVCHFELDLVHHLELDFVCHLELDLVCNLE